MHPSQFEIQREVEALRDIRRRSTAGGPGTLVLDPDLPNASTLSNSQHNYWDADNRSADDSSSSEHDGSDSGDPSSLFWVPARLHPEIAPAEFREFIKEHARAPLDGSGSLDRSFSNSGGLGRRKSMLNREYQPKANDGVENEGSLVPLRRNTSRLFANPGPQFTISDLQRLDELAEEASKSDDPTKLRRVLRRSLSLNVSPSVIEKMDDIPDPGDDVDVPIIIPRPGQVLRRSARTKIRKPGQAPGGAHTFTSRSRRVSGARATTIDSSDTLPGDYGKSKSFDGHSSEKPSSIPRPESFSEEAFIYDSYVREEPEEINTAPVLVTSPESPPLSLVPDPELQSSVPLPPLQHPIPQQPYLSPPIHETPSRTPSPEAPPDELSPAPSRSPEAPLGQHPSSLPERGDSRKDKDKKGLFGKWGGDKGGRKSAKEKEQREKEKDSASFFGSLFGGGKKKQEDYATNGLGHGSGRETAAALLGASKSSKNQHSPSPTPQGGPYARYPIHVERAIYRLSHIKLANPRRPLYEQVLISNLMFWYLGVINKTQNGAAQQGQVLQETNDASNTNTEEHRGKEQEERENAEKERLERENEREREKEQRKEPKRGVLTKTSQPGSRRAEMPVRGPQYEMQHRVMEQEYSYNQPTGNSGIPNRVASGSSQQHSNPPPLVQPQPQQTNDYYYTGNSPAQVQQPRPSSPGRSSSASLPPGAMPPASGDQLQMWKSASSPANLPASTSPSPPPGGHSNNPRRSRSPPAPNRFTPIPEKSGSTKLAGRSLSANAVPPPQSNGSFRKGASAHAVLSTSNEEDVPLALWQQQRRR